MRCWQAFWLDIGQVTFCVFIDRDTLGAKGFFSRLRRSCPRPAADEARSRTQEYTSGTQAVLVHENAKKKKKTGE